MTRFLLHRLGAPAGLILLLAPNASAQCRWRPGPGPLDGQAALLGLKISATPGSTVLQWAAQPNTCDYAVTWWAQANPGVLLGTVPLTGLTYTLSPQPGPGTYVVRVTQHLNPSGAQHEDQVFSIPVPLSGGLTGRSSGVLCDDGNGATDDAVANGICIHTNRPAGSPCSPPIGGTADGAGRCLSAPQSCDDGNGATDDAIANGVCIHSNRPAGSPCSPPVGGTADGAGRCLAKPLSCDDGNGATDDAIANGVCIHTNRPMGAPCSPPAGGVSDGAGKCLSAPLNCDDGNGATDDAVANGVCIHTNKPAGAACSPPRGGKADGMGHCLAPTRLSWLALPKATLVGDAAPA